MKALIELHFLSELQRLIELADGAFTRVEQSAHDWRAHHAVAHAPRAKLGTRLTDEEATAAFRARTGLIATQSQLFANVDLFLDSSARASLILFPTRKRSTERGSYLRRLLGVPDSSLLGKRDARNGWHHVDEGLDDFAEDVVVPQQFVLLDRVNSLMQKTTYRLLIVDNLEVRVLGRPPLLLRSVSACLASLRESVQQASVSWGERHEAELGTLEDYI